MSDAEGYPTDEELERIRRWPVAGDYAEFFEFVRSCWWRPEWGWREENGFDAVFKERPVRRYRISTGGWSGNEDIIAAMMENAILWTMTWVQSRRGGHFIFEVRREVASEGGKGEGTAEGSGEGDGRVAREGV